MKILQHMINQKVHSISADELQQYAQQMNIALTSKEADKIAACLRKSKADLFNEKHRAYLLKEITAITNPQTARQINQIFSLFIK